MVPWFSVHVRCLYTGGVGVMDLPRKETEMADGDGARY